jgi:Domain of unknown function (DUF6487)
MTQNACPDCGSAMEEGFIPDVSYGAVLQLAWHPGTPEDKKILGLKSGGVKLNMKESVKITARRCTKCGFLKLYAKPNSE